MTERHDDGSKSAAGEQVTDAEDRRVSVIYDSEIEPIVSELADKCKEHDFEMSCVVALNKTSMMSMYVGDRRFIVCPVASNRLSALYPDPAD